MSVSWPLTLLFHLADSTLRCATLQVALSCKTADPFTTGGLIGFFLLCTSGKIATLLAEGLEGMLPECYLS